MKKILFTIWGGAKGERSPFDPWFTAGGEIAAKLKSIALLKYNWEVHFFTISKRPCFETYEGIQLHQDLAIDAGNNSEIKPGEYYQERLTVLINDIKPDIIYSRGVMPTSMNVVPVAKQHNIPVVVAVDDQNFLDYFIDPCKNDWAKKIRYTFLNATGITVQHQGMIELLEKQLNISKYMRVISPGIDLNKFNNPPQYFDHLKKSGHITIIFLSRLEGSKRQDLFIDALPGIIQDVNNIHVILAGDGKNRLLLEKQVKNLGISSYVTFPGKIDNDQVPALLSISDLSIFLSNREGFPTVLLEYLASGNPIVASDIEPCKHILLNEINGIFVKNDVDDISRKMIDLLKHTKKIENMKYHNLMRSKSFDILHTAKELNNYLGELI